MKRKTRCLLHLIFFLMLFAIFLPGIVTAATEQRIALVIGNSAYTSGPLKNPVNDATDMAAMLWKLGFSVTLKKNASLKEMDEAIEAFGNRLKRGGVGLFYYAGHGVQVNGANYLLPIGAKINKEADVKYQAVDANKILDEMATANNGLNIVMLDACRDNPFGRSFRNAVRGLAIVSSAPSGTFISYSTSPGNVARDGDGRNSPYTEALLKYMQAPGLTISDVFINVRTKVKKETGQVPWELSSLEGQFYFMPGSAKTVTDRVESVVSKTSPTDELEIAMAKMQEKKDEEERRKSEKEESYRALVIDIKKYRSIKEANVDEALKERAWQALVRKYQQWSAGIATRNENGIIDRVLQEEKGGSFEKILNEEGIPFSKEVTRDGRFIAYSNGTVLDTSTNLMWAARDNGSDINWQSAKSYCENYRGGGHTDWRMPTQDELAGLYYAYKSRPAPCARNYTIHVVTELIDITCFISWAAETRGSDAITFLFIFGPRGWNDQSKDGYIRVLPVRSGK